jgi:hypothetical protein
LEPYESGGSHGVLAARGAESLGTDSKEFKTRAIALKNSYGAYPESHFDRWRKQGFWSREE